MFNRRNILFILFLAFIAVIPPAYAQLPQVSNGLNYLAATQSPSGTWESGAAHVETIAATVSVLETLKLLNQTASTSYTTGTLWLRGQAPQGVDAIAERLSILEISDSSLETLLTVFDNKRNAWGGDAEYDLNNLDTASALRALKQINYSDQTLIFKITNYLLSTQNSNGGWSFIEGNDSNYEDTARILSTLALFKGVYLTDAQLVSAANYLLANHNADGGFGADGSTAYETALAFIAIMESGQGQLLPLQNAVNYLTSTQSTNGSWNDDPYSTALAVRALALVKPELAIAATDIALSPSAPIVDSSLTVTATVHNNGLEAAGNVTVRLVDNGATVAEQTIASITSGGTGQATFTISPLTPAGEHVLSVVVDPANAIDETNKTNNSATARIWAKTQPDLAVLPENLTITPAYPKPGDTITLTAAIANLGESAAGAFSADLYDGDPNSGGVKLGSFSLPGIGGGEWGTGSVTFSFAAEGGHTLYLVADSQHAVNELITANNSASKSISISTAAASFFDLGIPMNGIQVNPARPHVGDSVTVTLLARNLGAETTTADLDLFDGDPATGGALLHKSTITLSVGETRTVTVPWTIPAGIHTLRAYIDRANVVAERDETNNSQSFTVMADMVDIEISASDIAIEPEHPMAGDPASVKLTIQNRGIKATGPFNVNLYNGDPNNGGTLLQAFPVADLAGDATQTIIYPFTAAQGTYRFYAVCDPENKVTELSEDNNLAIRSLLVKSSAEAAGPDLVPLEFDLSATTTDPQSLQISGLAKVKFQNKGDDKITTPFRITVFEDKDGDGAYTEGTDVSLGNWDYTAPMNPNMVGIVDVMLDGTLTFRNAPIYAEVDSEDVVYEQDEDNNTIRKGSACEARPVNAIEPVLKWQWPKSADPSFGEIRSTPVIMSLSDDNGDGKIDSRDNAAILVNAVGSLSTLEGKLWALKGSTGDPLFSTYTPNQAPVFDAYPLVGDIDGDGKPEIITEQRFSKGLLAFAHDGTIKWSNKQQIRDWDATHLFNRVNISESDLPVLADLDGDGHSEIVFKTTIFNNDGSVRCVPDGRQITGTGNSNGFVSSVTVADLDQDGIQEIIAGNTAINNDCSIKWINKSLPDGLTAVGNFDDDPYPEIVLVSADASPGTRVYLLDHTGAVKWGPVYLKNLEPETQYFLYGGHPLIADFDGDGSPEIGIRGDNKYFILDGKGNLKKYLPVPHVRYWHGLDPAVAPTVFDLNGDSRPEVIFHVDDYFRVFDGKDGTQLYQEYTGQSASGSQSVVIADVDGDSHAEVVLTGTNVYGTIYGNVRVYRAKNNDWASTRRIWNQPSYHATNINDDGSIPQYEAPSWLLNNNYRCQVPTATTTNPYLAADISASYVRVDMANFPTSVAITARIGNGGAKAVAQGLKTSFYNGDPANGGLLLGTAVTSKALNPGEYEDVTFIWNSPAEGSHTIYVSADAENTLSECDKANNTVSYVTYVTSSRPDLAVTLQINPQRPRLGETVIVTLMARNTGNASATATLELFDGDPAGGGTALHASTVTLNTGESRNIDIPWQVPAGIHTLTAYIDRANEVVEKDETNNSQSLTIMADMVDIEISASDIAIEPEQPMDGDPATVKLIVQNRGINSTGAFTVDLYNGDPASGGTLLHTFAISDLAGDGTIELAYPFTAARGTYRFYAVCDRDNRVSELYEDNNTAIRSLLVKSSAEAKGPDLVPLEFDLSGAITDSQTLRISGIATVKFQNKGDDKITTPFRITVFEDKDKDGVYTEGTDLSLGSVEYSAVINPNMVAVVPINLSGTLTFRDAPIYAMVDSGQVIFEQLEVNNAIRKGSACEVQPANLVEPVVKWKSSLPKSLAALGGPDSSPIVVNLTDDNGDGKIDAKDIPAVVFSLSSNNLANPRMAALRGDTGQLLYSVPNLDLNVSGDQDYLAAGDLDGDGKIELLEVRINSPSSYLIAYNNDGTVKWNNRQIIRDWEIAHTPFRITIGAGRAPVIADLDADGKPEIIVGSSAFNATDGSVKWGPPRSPYVLGVAGVNNYLSSLPIIADLDLDGKQEVIAGNTAYNADGTIKWLNQSLADGLNAVVNFGEDSYPDVVLVTSGTSIYLLDHNGQAKWGPVYLRNLDPESSSGGIGGAPVIADFDGDGDPEIGVKGFNKYLILDKSGRLKQTLSVPYQSDGSLSAPTVFDLNGDGRQEVMINSDGYFRIFDGKSGMLLFKEPFGASENHQNAIVADVNGDNHAEIVVVGRYSAVDDSSIRVYGAKNNDWVNTRRIWNQASYHVTNINDDGSIPQYEAPSWLLNNNYLCQVPVGTSTGNPYVAADLSASYIRADMGNYPTSVTITTRIGNGGAKVVDPGVKTSFYDGDPANGGTLIGTAIITKILNPGDFEDLSIVWNAPRERNHTIYVVADPDNTIAECDKANNTAFMATYVTNGQPDLSIVREDVVTRPSIYEGSLADVAITVRNPGTVLAENILLRLYNGNPAAGGTLVGERAIPSIVAGGSATTTVSWNTLGAKGTNYLYAVADPNGAIAESNEGNNTAIREVVVNAADKPDLQIAAENIVITPASPLEGDTLTVTASIHNRGSQTGNVKVYLYDGNPSAGGVKRGETFLPQQIANGGSGTASFTLDTIGLAGSHTFYVSIDPDNAITESDETNNQAARTITIAPAGLNAAIVTDKTGYSANEAVTATVTLAEQSGVARSLAYDLQVLDEKGAPAATVAEKTITLAANATQTFSVPWNTGTTYAGAYTLTARIKETGRMVAKASVPISITPVKTADIKVTVDKLAYGPNEQVAVSTTVTGNSPNYIYSDAIATTSITNGTGQPFFSSVKAIPSLANGQRIEIRNYWNTGTLAPGSYPVTTEVKDAQGAIITTATNAIVITGPKPSTALAGQISVDKQSVMAGEPITVGGTVTNKGNMDLATVAVTVLTVHTANQNIYNTISYETALAMNSSYAFTGQIDTSSLSAKDYLVILRATIDGVEETISSTYFRVEGAPSAPALAGPAEGSDVATLTPQLSVNNAADPNDDKVTHQFELYGDSGLTSLIASSGSVQEGSGISSWTSPVSLTENQTYYWRSRAYDGKLYGDWMAPASFRVNTVNDLPTAPTIAAPADGIAVATVSPALTVNNASDPDSASLIYNFDLALDPDFTSIVASTTGVASGAATTSWTVPTVLQENQWYYWRAQADDWQMDGPWSATARFQVNTANDAPTVPVITAPATGSTVAALNTTVVLTNSTDPDSPTIGYFFEADTVPTFDSQNVIRTGSIAAGDGSTTWTLTGLTDNTRYYIRTKASDGTAESVWSEVVSFFANTINDPPTTPIPANPSDGAGVNQFSPTLSVHNASDLDNDVLTYEFQVYADANLTTLVTQASGVTETASVTTWSVPVTLTENQTYYWRARAFDGTLTSTWSQTQSFMVNTANDAPGAPTVVAPENGSSIATLTPTLTIANAIDPDSDSLTYDFEVYAGTTLVAAKTGISGDLSGNTSWTSGQLSDNTLYQWRARAYDGDRYGEWMPMANFTTHLPVTAITAEIEFEPETLSQKSEGKWVTVEIELPHGYTASDIDIASIRLEGTVPAEPNPYQIHKRHHDDDSLKVKFLRSAVIAVLPEGNHVPVHVTGRVGTVQFEGADVIRVIKSESNHGECR